MRELRERHLSARRAQLDADELAAEWAEGRAMPSEQAVAYALEDDEASLASRSHKSSEQGERW